MLLSKMWNESYKKKEVIDVRIIKIEYYPENDEIFITTVENGIKKTYTRNDLK